MPLSRTLNILALLLAGSALYAQESLSRLGAVPRPDNAAGARTKAIGLHETFLYQYLPQTLPIIDDFSVDRTRHLGAQAGDPGVSLQQTLYALTVAGNSTPGMVFRTDTTWHYHVEITDTDTNHWKVMNPSVMVSVLDVTIHPAPPAEVVEAWPPWTIRDTVGQLPDTIHLTPALVQDSMMVYSVAADTRTYINPDNSTKPWILWEQDDVYVNGGFPIDPPTVGVATFDGCDRTGYAYAPDAPNSYGPADQLTSVPINLQFPAGDSIYLSFFVQPIGRSGDNSVLDQDSLILEFYAPGDQEWIRVWARPQTALHPFEQIMVRIIDFRFLQNGFRMRFRNLATLGGMVDQWHLDYVRLGRNRSWDDTVIDDVAFLYPEQTLLQRYTAVPWAKFAANPAGFMGNHITAMQRNLSDQDKLITWGYRSGLQGEAPAPYAGGNNVSGNASSIYPAQFPVTASPNAYTYTVPAGLDDADHITKLWLQATPDACRYNDTITVRQHFSNYYAYDDGTAELGYSILGTEAAKRFAYRFDSPGGDTLRALRMYFAPIFSHNPPSTSDPRLSNFLLTVWSSLDPEVVLFQNLSFHSPEYVQWGMNTFAEYAFDEPVYVEGAFYVGVVQTNTGYLSLGTDMNRVNNDRMFFNPGTSWQQSGIQGSWMVRPVVSAASDPWASVPTTEPNTALRPYPNPTQNGFRFEPGPWANGRVQLFDATGRTVHEQPVGNGYVPTEGLMPGVYLVRTTDRNGTGTATGRVIVQ